jgi:predicted enzyme related to lactoylglutathione lyase
MKRTWPIIAVKDVQASSRWYQQLLGCTNNHPGKDTFDQIQATDGTVLVCFHASNGEHGHPPFADLAATRGCGVLLYFCVDDFDAALERARALDAPLAEEPHHNPNAHSMEFSLRDPDGYYVTISDFDAGCMLR